MFLRLLGWALALTAASPAVADNGTGASLPPTAPATVLESTETMMPSAISGRTYRIDIYKPPVPPPPGGYPVVFLTDGELNFATAVGQLAMRQGENWRPAILVGIGYSSTTMLDMFKTRARDLTPAAAPEATPGINPADIGGDEAFYRFLTEELRPALAKAYPIDLHDQTLYGYSFGGLFALDILFRHTDAFTTYVMGSPSIWWADRVVLANEKAFADKVAAGRAAPRLYISVGGLEQTVTSYPAGVDHAKVDAAVAKSRQVDNARELAQRLSALKGAAGYVVKFELYPDETHVSGMPRAISHGLNFALAH